MPNEVTGNQDSWTKARERQRRYRERHREELRERCRKRAATPEDAEKNAAARSRHRFGGLREIVLDRDGRRCRSCGAVYDFAKRNLVVHHIDFDPKHNVLENLITLCRSCHPKRHSGWTEERRSAHSKAMRAAGAGLWMKGRRRPPETTAKTAEANRGRKHSPEAIAKMREAKRLWWARQPAARKTAIGKKLRAFRK